MAGNIRKCICNGQSCSGVLGIPNTVLSFCFLFLNLDRKVYVELNHFTSLVLIFVQHLTFSRNYSWA